MLSPGLPAKRLTASGTLFGQTLFHRRTTISHMTMHYTRGEDAMASRALLPLHRARTSMLFVNPQGPLTHPLMASWTFFFGSGFFWASFTRVSLMFTNPLIINKCLVPNFTDKQKIRKCFGIPTLSLLGLMLRHLPIPRKLFLSRSTCVRKLSFLLGRPDCHW